jgi:glycerol-3-phosphate acyltransferase PlsY
VWLKFRGGKGVATGLGSFLLLTPKAIVVALGIFIVVAIALRYVAFASIIAAASLPVLALLLGEGHDSTELALVASASVLIIAKHHQNIRRMLFHAEPKFQLRRK